MLFVAAFTAAEGQAPGPLRYVYDPVGRLVGVVDGAGNAAQYVYDAVGNLLAIERWNVADLPGAVGITLVSPAEGPVGTPVQVFGKGFSTTAGQNVVTFNGVAAPVTAATLTSLTTTVPPGATTGPITVTAPLGAATWPGPFRVLGLLTVTPTAALAVPGASLSFTAAEGGTPTSNVRWSVNGIVGGEAAAGTISTAGVYTAPTVTPLARRVTVAAIGKSDPTLTATAVVEFPESGTVVAAAALSLRIQEAPVINQAVGTAVSTRLAEGTTLVTAGSSGVGVAREPAITSVTPGSAPPGTTGLTVTLTGSGFTGATSVTLERNAAADSSITVSAPAVSGGGTQATVTMSVAAGAPAGPRVVRITVEGSTSTALGTGGNPFAVP